MSETTTPEEIDVQENVELFISIHMQRAKRVAVTKISGQDYQYLGEATYVDPGSELSS